MPLSSEVTITIWMELVAHVRMTMRIMSNFIEFVHGVGPRGFLKVGGFFLR